MIKKILLALTIFVSMFGGLVSTQTVAGASSVEQVASFIPSQEWEHFIELDLTDPVLDRSKVFGGIYKDHDFIWKFRHNNKAKERIFTPWEITTGMSLAVFTGIPLKTTLLNCTMYLGGTQVSKTVPIKAKVTPLGPDESLKGNIFNGHYVLLAELSSVSFGINEALYNEIKANNNNGMIDITFSGIINRESRYIIPVDKDFTKEMMNGQGRTWVPFELTTTKNEDTYSEPTDEYWEDIKVDKEKKEPYIESGINLIKKALSGENLSPMEIVQLIIFLVLAVFVLSVILRILSFVFKLFK